jgi:single-strand DNA-binding protein
LSRSVNRVILVGNAGADPDVRRTSTGRTVAHLSLATNRVFLRDGEEQRRTDWHRLTFWSGAAETIEPAAVSMSRAAWSMAPTTGREFRFRRPT